MGYAKDRPDFLIIGSMKCGTTTLYDDLARLDALYLPSDKEPWILVKHADRGQIKRAYAEHFRGADDAKLCGEGSTGYTCRPLYEGVAERALDVCGRALRLIMIMRDPVERIYSHLRHDLAEGTARVSDIDRLVLEDEKYVAISDYAMQLRPWVDAFGPERLYCVGLSEYREDRSRVVQEIARFLGVEPGRGLALDPDAISNASSELRRTGRALASVLQLRAYRRYVRPLMSDRVRHWARKALTRKVTVPRVRLSEATEARLRERLAGVEERVAQLIGRRVELGAVSGERGASRGTQG
jgi:hypothetical protein